jgi:cytochrome c-type biogenesis protein CcmH
MALIVAVPVAAIYLYTSWGEPAGITGEVAVVAGNEEVDSEMGDEHPDTGAQVEAMVAQLAARMEQNPDDMEGWLMLARSYRYLRRHAEAIQAFEKAMPMVESNSQLMADYADTLAMATDGSLEGKPMRYIKKALDADPGNIQALWLAGTHHYEKGEYADALTYWRRLKRMVSPGSQDADAMAANIAEVELRMKELGLEIPSEDAAPVVAEKAPSVIAGKVSLQADLQEQVSPDDTVFIYARAIDGPRMPLAIVRKKVSELPTDFVLDESMAMMPGMSLSHYPNIIVGARISKSGNAMPQSGDLEGSTGQIKVGATGLNIVINTVVP